MASDDEVIEIPIELAQEYVTAALGFAPLQLSDDNHLGALVDKFAEALYDKYGKHLTQKKVEVLIKALKVKMQGQQNVLFDKFDEDLPQASYSKRQHVAVLESIKKHEDNLLMLNVVKDKIDKELADLKVIEEDLNGARASLDAAINSQFGASSVNGLVQQMEQISNLKQKAAEFLHTTNRN